MALITEATLVEDMKRLQAEREKKELEALRARLLVSSREDAEKRMEENDLALATTLQFLQEAYLSYDETEDVDFETALDRTRKMEKIEHDFDVVARHWNNQRKRVDWERKLTSAPGADGN